MAIRQISVFVENQKGKLYETLSVIAGEGINIRALSVADTNDFGVLRLITSDTDKTKEVLSRDCVVNTTTVIAAKLEDRVGALCDVIKILADADINIEYVYAFTASEDFGAYVVIRVDDVDKAQKALENADIPTLDEDDIKDI
ncbi:MAG TPA: acetolactate synthase [Ruminococcaceae bacterium]|nr:acetolactate synthase [Oscillospiraceae bacterium]